MSHSSAIQVTLRLYFIIFYLALVHLPEYTPITKCFLGTWAEKVNIDKLRQKRTMSELNSIREKL